MNVIDELKWRGLVQDITPGTKELFDKETVKAYIGFDPTADSLHIGSLVQIFILMHLQRSGHIPYALVGGATGMVGDPSGKSNERNLLSDEELQKNINGIQKQLSKFIKFDNVENSARIVNNYDWFKKFGFLEFIRDVGKHITVNYMMAKDSVKQRFTGEVGISFTEFSYQLIQGYDFLHLNKHHGIKVQMGGSDQWGNITTGMELIKKMGGGEAYAFTAPLVKKADGTKFGKTEQGNIWLDSSKTSPYKFYQFWLNASDEDSKNWIKIFTFLPKDKIEILLSQHEENPHLRIIQKTIAEELTILVHSQEEFDNAVLASEILFGKSTKKELDQLEVNTLFEIFEGVPTYSIEKTELKKGINIIDFLSVNTNIYASKGETKRALQGNAIAINQEKINSDQLTISEEQVINDKFILVRKGKKDYHLVLVENS